MGTNYYAIPKLSEKNKQLAIQAINEEKFGLARELLPDQIHIGKSSAGWEFLLNHNDFEYYKNVSEMFEWLKGCEISDEYGRVVTHEEFIEVIESKKKSPSKMNRPDWYVREGEYVFSTSTDFC